MGQRLVFKCIKKGKVFAAIYFHWSCYTDQVYVEAKKLIDGLFKRGYKKTWGIPLIQTTLAQVLYDDFVEKKMQVINPQTGKFLTALEERHGGIANDDAEFKAFESLLGTSLSRMDRERISRSCGVLAILPETIKKMTDCAEGIEHIDFDAETFTNGLFYEMEPTEDVLNGKDYESISPWNPPNGYIEEIKWGDREKAHDWYFDNYGKDNYYILGKLNNGNVMTSV